MKKSRITSYLAKAGMIVMLPVFLIVMWAEKLLAWMFHLTYNEINILVYYLLIPLSWTAIIDYKTGIPVLSPLLLLFWSCLLWKTWGKFSQFCDVAFKLSQLFLLKFQKIGWNYIVSSVIICVFVPALVYFALFTLL